MIILSYSPATRYVRVRVQDRGCVPERIRAESVEELSGGAAPVAAPVAAAPVAAPAPAAAPAAPAPAAGGAGSVKVSSPMPGKILAVKANVGDSVKKGQVILILEAMKMENEVVAPEDGTIASIDVTVGASVESGDTLATLN